MVIEDSEDLKASFNEGHDTFARSNSVLIDLEPANTKCDIKMPPLKPIEKLPSQHEAVPK
jgi:hypothetical protein